MDFTGLNVPFRGGPGGGYGQPPSGGGPPGARKGGGNVRPGAYKKHCNCKNSRCLKLYCECFASGRYCENCNCSNCFNNHENEMTRQAAVESILERNPNAFRPKIQGHDDAAASRSGMLGSDGQAKHAKGCNCKKSACLKKYCECFQAGVYCSSACKCMDCRNFEGSDQREQVVAGALQTGPPVLDPTAGIASPHKRMRAGGGGGGLPLPLPGMVPGAGGVPGGFGPPHQHHGGPLALAAPPRPTIHQAVGDIVKGSVVDELCRLLFLVAHEERARHVAAAAATTANGNGPGVPDQAASVDAQERAVLREFLDMFQKVADTAKQKVAVAAQSSAAVAAAMAAMAASSGGLSPLASLASGTLPPHLMAAAAAAAASVIGSHVGGLPPPLTGAGQAQQQQCLLPGATTAGLPMAQAPGLAGPQQLQPQQGLPSAGAMQPPALDMLTAMAGPGGSLASLLAEVQQAAAAGGRGGPPEGNGLPGLTAPQIALQPPVGGAGGGSGAADSGGAAMLQASMCQGSFRSRQAGAGGNASWGPQEGNRLHKRCMGDLSVADDCAMPPGQEDSDVTGLAGVAGSAGATPKRARTR